MASEIGLPLADRVDVTVDMLIVHMKDGRSISVPLVWFPRLMHGTRRERDDWKLSKTGDAISWPALGDKLAVADLLAGRMSHESALSLERWLDKRAGPVKATKKH